jgi:NAD-dependent deacetylase
MLVVGTSASVAPASELPQVAKRNGAHILEINPADSGLGRRIADLHIREPAGPAFRKLLQIVKSIYIEG